MTSRRSWKIGGEGFTMAISDNFVYVAIGEQTRIEKYDLFGNLLKTYSAWYFSPLDILATPDGQVLLSAIGAAKEKFGEYKPGLVLYDKEGEFLRGYHEEDTQIKHPHGLSFVPINMRGEKSYVGVCGWDNNRTSVLDIDWQSGIVDIKETDLIQLPYVYSMVFTSKTIVAISWATGQARHLSKMVIFDDWGTIVREVKYLPTREKIESPQALAVDDKDNIWLVDRWSLNKTVVFDSDGNYIGEATNQIGTPTKIIFHQQQVYSLTDSYVKVYDIDY